MLDIRILKSIGIDRTHNTIEDEVKFFEHLANHPEDIATVKSATVGLKSPFYRFFANYGTGIGETLEEAMGEKFIELVPKTESKFDKFGNLLKTTNKSEIYKKYNTDHGKKPSNYDYLGDINSVLKSFEIKGIRAAEGKITQENKLFEIPSLLEERALSYADKDKNNNWTFQQTKPDMFDYLLGVVMYTDQVDLYIVPSDDIKTGKLKITNQHAGAIMEDGGTKEGHLSIKELDEYRVLSMYSETELLSKDSLSKYIK